MQHRNERNVFYQLDYEHEISYKFKQNLDLFFPSKQHLKSDPFPKLILSKLNL